MIYVGGRKGRPVIQVCKSLKDAEKIAAEMKASGFKNVRIGETRTK
ncbi:hypothetical protein [Bradyrhizobium quebecense]|uniref:Rhodanese domain-containing protein n=2 Tax=Bradyrhizobium quebecense TaxID=2748629 RepID=A0ABS3MDC6_9BRAD|nr:hypothetical protein [Bradyrhizobium quebecense]UGY04764.1 hypothetical protein J4P68_0008480 [Bradyrhizobium quebecense]